MCILLSTSLCKYFYLMKKDLLYVIIVWLSLFAVVSIYFSSFQALNLDLSTMYDEGWYFLQLKKCNLGIFDNGLTQWDVIASKVLGKSICSNILYLRYAKFFLKILTLSSFFTICIIYFRRKQLIKKKIDYVVFFVLVFLFGSLTLGGQVISYNYLQEFYLLNIIALFLLSTTMSRLMSRIMLFIVMGFLFAFAILTTFPSAVMIFMSIFVLLYLFHEKALKKVFFDFATVLIGILLGFVVYHFNFLSLEIVLDNITQTAAVITKVKRGYDINTFLVLIGFYFRDLLIHFSLLIGAYLIASLLGKATKSIIGALFFLVFLSIFIVYLKKPYIYVSTLIIFPVVLIWYDRINAVDKVNWKRILNFDIAIKIFLFFAPLLSSIGTNIPLSSKMLFFVSSWSILFVFELLKTEEVKANRKLNYFLLFIPMFVIYLFPLISSTKKLVFSNKESLPKELFSYDKSKTIRGMEITQKQFKYFQLVDTIFTKYKFDSKKDYIFSLNFDMMTIAVFDARPTVMHLLPNDFLSSDKSELKAPDFIFLTEFDSINIYSTLQSLKWGFPNDYDRYAVGTPEESSSIFKTDRVLYCRKVIKKDFFN